MDFQKIKIKDKKSKMIILIHSLLVLFLNNFIAHSIASAADKCELFEHANFEGRVERTSLQSVEHTFASGSPNNRAWANSSYRAPKDYLLSADVYKKVSSVRIRAWESDVSLYLFEGDDFNERGWVLHCKKGYSCWSDNLGSFNDKTGSYIVQREFYRKAYNPSGSGGLLGYINAAKENPVIPLEEFSNAVSVQMRNGFENIDEIDEYDDEYTRTTWTTDWRVCKEFDLDCAGRWREKYDDIFKISKRFEIDVDNFWLQFPLWAWLPFIDDTYDVQIDWYIRPVLSGSEHTLQFWWWITKIWVGNGTSSGTVRKKISPRIYAIDIQKELRNGVIEKATKYGCAQCIDGKRRLQMSIYSENKAKQDASVWWDSFNMDRTHPKMVLNQTRSSY